MPFLYPVTEVREWQRAAVQARCGDASGMPSQRGCWRSLGSPAAQAEPLVTGVMCVTHVRHTLNFRWPGKEATPAGGESGGRRAVRPRGGRAGAVTHESLRAVGQSYQPVIRWQLRPRCSTLCCRTVGSSVESDRTIAAAFFDLDKTIISRSSTLAFGPSFYRHGLITRGEAVRTAFAQLAFRLGGADHQRMERIRGQVGELCRGWSAERVSEIVGRHLNETI